MSLAIVLLPAFMARGRQTGELAQLPAAAEPAGVSDLGPIDKGRKPTNPRLLRQLCHDGLVSGFICQLLHRLLHASDLRLDETQLRQQTAQRLTTTPAQACPFLQPIQPATIGYRPSGS